MKLKTTYDPCNVCKRELLIRQELYKADIEVYRPVYFDPILKSKFVVWNHKTFQQLKF